MTRTQLRTVIAISVVAAIRAGAMAQNRNLNARSRRPIEGSDTLRNLQVQLQREGLPQVVAELNHRIRNYDSLEQTLIQCVEADSSTLEGRALRCDAARLLGRMQSQLQLQRAIATLVDNISLSPGMVVASSSDMGFGDIGITHSCVRALTEIGTVAQRPIIERIAEIKEFDHVQLELAAYCLLRIQAGRDRSLDARMPEMHRRAVLQLIEETIQEGKGNVDALTRLKQFAVEIEPKLYEYPRSPVTVELQPPENSEYFKRNPLPDRKAPAGSTKSSGPRDGK